MTNFLLILIVGVLAIIPVYLLEKSFRQWRLTHRKPVYENSAILFAYFTTGNDLVSSGRRKLSVKGGAICTDIITKQRKERPKEEVYEISAPAGKKLLLVELPFHSKLHLLAVGKGAELDKLSPIVDGSSMQTATLEGDFDKYFSIYIDRGQDTQLRYVFDPAAMKYVIDFCRKYHWEIVNDSIYFASDKELPNDDVIVEFIEQIRPALETN
ncbi:MAG: hypothetical protein Q7T74_07310 [Candidatus Saccharibacteria bacterium]|nr:hypothetical protein [Candidatus Saccharibacteria bacterium]